MKNPLLLLSTVLFFSLVTYVFAEDVKITTSYPSPYGVYKQLQVLNQDESSTITDYTQGLIKSGLNIVTDYTGGAYTPGIFWSTQNDNPTKPKAGVWMRETSTGSELYMGTSNDYTTGITNTGLILDKEGNVGIGTTAPRPKAALDVASTTKGLIPPRMTTTQRNNIPSLTAADAGMLIYNLDTSTYDTWNGSAWVAMSGGTGGVACNTITTGVGAGYEYGSLSLLVGTRNICKDANGCSFRVAHLSAATHKATQDGLLVFLGQMDNNSWETFDISGNSRYGVNGDTVDKQFSGGMWAYLFDDRLGTETSPDEITWRNQNTSSTYLIVTVCDV